MNTAFYTGVSGVKMFQTGVDVVSENLANVDTTGYKSQRTEFSSIYIKSIATAGVNNYTSGVGEGAFLNATTTDTTQGPLQSTERLTDLAINGNGYFGIKSRGDEPQVGYTRTGRFTFNKDRDLLTYNGFDVLGTKSNNMELVGEDDSGEPVYRLSEKIYSQDLGNVDAQEPLHFPKNLITDSNPTTVINIAGNIGEAESASVSTNVFTAAGEERDIHFAFTQQLPPPAEGRIWNATATITSKDGTETYSTAEGVLTFDANGGLLSSTLTSIDNDGTASEINLGSGFTGIISNGDPDQSLSIDHDGTKAGTLNGYEINENAEVIATFDNGEQSVVAKIAVYHFRNPQGLDRVSNDMYQTTANSGQATFWTENGKNVNGAKVEQGFLEASNVTMENALTQMIIMQRSLGASSTVIKTADQLIQKALNM